MAKKYIKEEILNTARRLFNQRGYAEVSMRDIAEALGISVGNLTYHYKKKQDILEAVVQEMERWQAPMPVPATLPELNALFARYQNSIQENAFYFWHFTQLAELSPLIRELQTEKVKQQYARLQAAFQNLAAAGLMQPESRKGEYRRLIQALQLICVHWVPQGKLEEGVEEAQPRDFLDCIWTLLLPLLTPAGRDVYIEKIVKVRMEFE